MIPARSEQPTIILTKNSPSRPDPFMPNLKVDFLPEIRKEPNILSHFTAVLQYYGLKSDVDQFLTTKNITLLETIRMKLFLHKKESLAKAKSSHFWWVHHERFGMISALLQIHRSSELLVFK